MTKDFLVNKVRVFFTSGKWILPVSIPIVFLLSISGCLYYKAVEPSSPPYDILSNPDNGTYQILHIGDLVYRMEIKELLEEGIQMNLTPLEGHDFYLKTRYDRPTRFRKNKKIDETEVLNEVHIYALEYMEGEKGEKFLPYKNIESVILYDKANGAIVGSWLMSTYVIGGGIYGAGLGIALLFKSSCPFVYSYDGQNFALSGEIYSGSIYPALERDDYLALNNLKPSDNVYKLQLTNEVREIQHTNMVELLCIDHEKGTEVWFDKYGQYHVVSEAQSPDYAVNLQDEDILEEILSSDQQYYSGMTIGSEKTITDGMIMEFQVPQETRNINLMLKAKNSLWLEYVFKTFHDMLGSRYEKYTGKKFESGREALLEDMKKNQLYISVYLHENDEWKFVNYFNLAGPIAYKEDILNIPVGANHKGKIRIKLEYGCYFWDIDHVAIDISGNQDMEIKRIPLSSALNEEGKDVIDLLRGDDDAYYVQPDIGNSATLTFDIPEMTGSERSLILHSKGYYLVVREPRDKVQLKELKKIKKEGGLPYLSWQLANRNKGFFTMNGSR